MKKLSILAILIALVIASFALPSFAEEGCNANTDYLALGHEQHHAGDYQSALASANCGLSFDRENYLLWMLLAEVYCHTGEFDLSVDAYSHAIEIRPNSGYAYNNRGWANYQHGDMYAAMFDLNHAIELDSEMAYAFNNRGLVWQTLGERENARADFEQAIALGLDEAWAEINLYNVEFEIEKLKQS